MSTANEDQRMRFNKEKNDELLFFFNMASNKEVQYHLLC